MSPPGDLRRIAQSMRRDCLALRVRQLNRRVTRIYDTALRPLGVTTAQLNVLVAVALGGAPRPAAIARVLDLEKSTLSRNLRRMAEHGWIDIGAAGGNGGGGAQEVRLLPAGRRLLERALPLWRAAQRRAGAEIHAGLIEALQRASGPAPAGARSG